jgi:DNA-binding response OmpR family regulator/anti-sigma regulatory factor (Ser/Thr protein kinase)
LLVFAGTIYLYIWYARRQERLKYEIKLAHLESEKEKNLTEKKISFFTHVSHEFRAPLTLIIDPLQQAMKQPSGLVPVEDLAVAHRNARRLLSLVDQLLLFRKADSGADVLKVSEMNIVALCREVYQCFSHQAQSRHIHYPFHASTETIIIQGDYQKIEIALFNLLSNAFKFTPDGGRICFSVIESGQGVRMEVEDSGCGIAPEEIGGIFGKFRQVESMGTSKVGFGIGLYLVKQFIESHKGMVSCGSKPGQGASFSIFLFKSLPSLTEAYIEVESGANPGILEELMEDRPTGLITPAAPLEGKTSEEMLTAKSAILIIDDNVEISGYLEHMFAPYYIIYSADNGTEGLRLAERYVPDLIISDIHMKGMDGVELCTKIKESESLGHIPVILMTGASGEDLHLKGLEVGADDYITKPFDVHLLKAKMESILRNRNILQKYFFDSITLKESSVKVPVRYQQFLSKCIQVVEENIDTEDFTIKKFSKAMGMSHSGLYQRIKSVSGQTTVAFIRSIRLRRAAVLMLQEEMPVNQAAFQVGIGDTRYFREQFLKQFGITPSEYIKKYRHLFSRELNVIRSEDV